MKRKETKEDFFQVVAVPNNLCDLHCDLLRKVMRVLLSVRAQEKRKKKLLSISLSIETKIMNHHIDYDRSITIPLNTILILLILFELFNFSSTTILLLRVVLFAKERFSRRTMRSNAQPLIERFSSSFRHVVFREMTLGKNRCRIHTLL